MFIGRRNDYIVKKIYEKSKFNKGFTTPFYWNRITSSYCTKQSKNYLFTSKGI